MKKGLSVTIVILFLLLFVPVFYHMIFWGTQMNYNELHKITTIYSNKWLLFYGFLVLSGILAIFFYIKKWEKWKFGIAFAVFFSLFFSIVVYCVNVIISKCIFFYGGWDCGMVANSAIWLTEGQDLGYGEYYYVFSNNIPVIWVLYRLYLLAEKLSVFGYKDFPDFIWVYFQCICFSVTVFFSSMTVLVISRKWTFSALTTILCGFFMILSPWKIIPYTDGITVFFPVAVLFFYACQIQTKKIRKKLIFNFLFLFVGLLGGIFKATVFVSLIAVIFMDCCCLFFEKQEWCLLIKKIALKLSVFMVAVLLAWIAKQQIYVTLGYVKDQQWEATWSNYLYMGLDEETTGASNDKGYLLIHELYPSSKTERMKIEISSSWDIIKEKGIRELSDFYLRKLVMSFNDGTFSWFQEGRFKVEGRHSTEELTKSHYKELLQSYFWEGEENYEVFTTISQGIWIFTLFSFLLGGVVFVIKNTRKSLQTCSPENEIHRWFFSLLYLIFIGMLLFVMLFEGRARYLFNYTPFYLTGAVFGIMELSDYIDISISRRFAGDK